MPVKSENTEEASTTATKESCGVIRCCDAKDKSSFTAWKLHSPNVKNYQQKCNFSSYLKHVTKLLTHIQEQQCAGPGSHWFDWTST